jgi:hypothetical protein
MLNVDATTFKDPSHIGTGVVIGDHVRDFEMSLFCKKTYIVEELAQVLVVRYGLQKNIIFSKSLCLLTITMLQKNTVTASR